MMSKFIIVGCKGYKGWDGVEKNKRVQYFIEIIDKFLVFVK